MTPLDKMKYHLAGLATTLCGIPLYDWPYACIAKTIEQVNCKKCMKTEDYRRLKK